MYDNECTNAKNVYQIPTYIQKLYKLYKTCKMCKENMYKNRLKYGLKLETGVCCTYKQCTNYTKCMKMLIESYVLLLMYDLCIQDPNILYFSNFCFNNDAIFRAILQLCKILGPMFSYSKRFTDESILSIYLVLI